MLCHVTLIQDHNVSGVIIITNSIISDYIQFLEHHYLIISSLTSDRNLILIIPRSLNRLLKYD
jgi:hypothetical protein